MIVRKDRILILLFVAVLIVPVLAYPFLYSHLDTGNHENRTLAEFPDIGSGSAFFGGLTEWFNDHLPYKNQMVALHSELFLSLFDSTPNPRVVIGEDGWLFYNNYDAENPIDDIMGKSAFSDEEMDRIGDNLESCADRMEERETAFVFLLAPNKETVCSDLLPGYLRKGMVQMTRADILAEHLAGRDILFVYPKEELEGLKDGYQLYYRYDTHWNRLGGYVGTRSVCDAVGVKLPALTELEIGTGDGYPRDLSDLAGIGGRCTNDTEFVIRDFFPDVEVRCEDAGGVRAWTSDAEDERTVLVVHDSYYRSMAEYLPKVFRTVIDVDRNYSDLYSVQRYIDEYHPDIVIMEVVERGIQILLHENMPY